MTWRQLEETNEYEISCDVPGCDETTTVKVGQKTAAQVQQVLFKRGWDFLIGDGGRDVCPTHAQQAKP